MTKPTGRPRGFAGLSPERRREIAAMGGRAQPEHKRTFFRDPEFAAEMGRLGGLRRKSDKEEIPL